MKTSSIFSVFVLSIVLIQSGAAIAGEAGPTPIEKLISEMADTPEEHQAIAG